MKTVMAFGTFDVFHPGHRSYLTQAKKLGDFLVAVVARDATVVDVKKIKAQDDEMQRLGNVKNSGLVDEAVLGDPKNRYAAIQKFRPEVIALGYDQRADEVELEKKLQEFGLQTEVVRMEAYQPEKYKSSKLKLS